jgi:hypothetical protein
MHAAGGEPLEMCLHKFGAQHGFDRSNHCQLLEAWPVGPTGPMGASGHTRSLNWQGTQYGGLRVDFLAATPAASLVCMSQHAPAVHGMPVSAAAAAAKPPELTTCCGASCSSC